MRTRKRFISMLLAVQLMLPVQLTGIQAEAAEPTLVSTTAELVNAVKAEGTYQLGADLDIDKLTIGKNITLDGAGCTLTSANTVANLGQATIAHASDGLQSVFQNITLDGGGQQKTDTCLWLGRGTWIWHNVTLQNWASTSKNNRGAITLGKSQNSPGHLYLYGGVIENNRRGLSLDKADAIADIYGITARDNDEGDIYVTSGTVNFLDDENAMPKTAGTMVLSGGTVNLSGNTMISKIVYNSGTLNITGDLAAEGTMVIEPGTYTDGAQLASVSADVDVKSLEGRFALPAEQKNYRLAFEGDKLILKEKTKEDAFALSHSICIPSGDVSEQSLDLKEIAGIPADLADAAYALGSVNDAEGILDGPPSLNSSVMTYKGNGKAAGNAIQNIVVSSSNYEDSVIEITFLVTAKEPVANAAGSGADAVVYNGKAIDLPAVSNLFEIDPNAGGAVYTIESSGTTGAGSIGEDGKTLTVTKAGEFRIGLVTAETGTHVAGAKVTAMLTVKKGVKAAPPAPVQENVTAKSVTLTANEGMEYKRGDGEWQNSPQFGGLMADTDYTFYQRYRENDLYEASDASPGLAVRTEPPAEIMTEQELKQEVSADGKYRLGADISVDQLQVKANITLDGNGHKLISANAQNNMGQATMAHLSDGLRSTFKNITFDGAGQQKTDTCLWLGRGAWIWQDVRVQNWVSTSEENRGAITLGCSGKDPGHLQMYGGVIENNKRGLSVAHADAIADIYGITAGDNETGDIYVTAGTVNFLDDENAMPKTAETLVLDGGTVNLSGNTHISRITYNGGSLNITGALTSNGVIVIDPGTYADEMQLASVAEEVDPKSLTGRFVLPAGQQGYRLVFEERKLMLREKTKEDAFTLSANVCIPGRNVSRQTLDLEEIPGIPSDLLSKTYALGNLRDTEQILDGAPSLDGSVLTYKGNGKMAGTAVQHIIVSSSNYEDSVIEITFLVTSKSPVINAAGSGADAIVYAGNSIDLSAVRNLFVIDPNAGAAAYTIEGSGTTGTGTVGADKKTLTVTKAGTFKIGLVTAETETHVAGAKVTAVLTVNKGVKAAPSTPVQENVTAKSVTLTANEGMEYKRGDGAWQNSPQFGGLMADTDYTFYQRYRENDLYEASDASPGLTVRTEPPAEIMTEQELKQSVSADGNYRFGADISVDQLQVKANITLDGNGHKLISANSQANIDKATAAHLSDGLSSTFKNITFDGAGQQKTDTCLWLGRGAWTWQDVRVQNWVSTSDKNRGAITLGCSGKDPGHLYVYGAVIEDNRRGLSLDHADAVADIYGIKAKNNETGDIYLTSGTVNFLDDENKMPKAADTLVLSGGTVNLAGNTFISMIRKGEGALYIAGELTAEQGRMTIIPDTYRDGLELAEIAEGLDADLVLERFQLPQGEEEYTLEAVGQKLVLRSAKVLPGAVNNIPGSATVTYPGTDIDLSEVDGLFAIDEHAGTAVYSIEQDQAATGAGTIGEDGRTLTATKAGTFTIGLVTEETEHYQAGALVTAALTVEKAGRAAPAAPVAGSVKCESVTLKTASGMEYRRGNGKWQSSPTFNGLAAGKSYTFYQRQKETALYHASAVSKGLTVKTKKDTNAPGYEFQKGDLKYRVAKKASAKKAGSATVAGMAKAKAKAKASKVSIPATVKNGSYTYKVEVVAKKAFQNNKYLKAVTIGANIKEIQEEAFCGCSKLTRVILGKNVTKVGKKAFYNAKNLNDIRIQGKKLKTVGKQAFQNTYKKAVVRVPSSKKKAYRALLKGKGLNKKASIK